MSDTDEIDGRLKALERAFAAHLQVAHLPVAPVFTNAQANQIVCAWITMTFQEPEEQ